MATPPRIAHSSTQCGSLELIWGKRTYIMGIVNMTPDSFTGDGLGDNVEAALLQARQMEAEGADLIDVGGESTRPGHQPVPAEEELRRVLPAVRRLARELSVPVSVDTYKAQVAERCVQAGAAMINDIWGFKRDADMAAVAARYHVPVVLMHNQEKAEYTDLVPDVIAGLRDSINRAVEAGVRSQNIILDPGIGFGKTPTQNLELMRRLSELRVLGYPILLGTSRKFTIGKLLSLPPDQRVEGTAATVAIGIANGADIVRVHDVREMRRVVRVSDAIVRARW